MVGIASVAD